jgi:putative endonuclease
MSRKRQRAERHGRIAESIAALAVTLKGYRVLGRRVRTPYGEVDVAATHKGRFIAVEVKARPTKRSGQEALPPEQRKRITRAATAAAKRYGLGGAAIQMDVVIVLPWGWPIHLPNAWEGQPRRTYA